ncbi:hypothetical protein HZF02_32615 (plasmid) [Pseudomonas yamanorum]|nr:hypothetical protein HZF02_32615 [Pseudomonas yamanorum]
MNANIGKLNSGKCYVYLNGYSSEPFCGTEAECEAAIARHGVADPIPVFLDGVDLTTSTKPLPVVVKTARLPLREYVMTFKAADGSEDGTSGYVENVFARDRNEAMRKGRDIVRENAGPYGPKIRISARLG